LKEIDKSFSFNSSWEILEKISRTAEDNVGYHRLKRNKSWFENEFSKLVDKRKQAKLKWLQNPKQISGENLQNFRRDTSRIFRKKGKGILQMQI
jgi:hypothetical protein